jgi:hypothetical protein
MCVQKVDRFDSLRDLLSESSRMWAMKIPFPNKSVYQTDFTLMRVANLVYEVPLTLGPALSTPDNPFHFPVRVILLVAV